MNYLKKLIEKILPTKYQLKVRLFYQIITNKIDEEIIYIDKILKNKRRFIDIGANVGIYSYFFYDKFEKIESFEPLKEITFRLNNLSKDKLNIHNIALSNKKKNSKLYIPKIKNELIYPLSSINKFKKKKFSTRNVAINTLDSFKFDQVDLIKIDVEGHEVNVIWGAKETIKKNRPIIICEIEQRHIKNNINEVFKEFKKLNYKGFFMKEKKLMPIKYFSYEKNQKPYLNNVDNKNYINNFIFFTNT